MKQIWISDTTLCRNGHRFSFKEKLEIARQLERLCVDAIELPEIADLPSDVLLVRTLSAFVKKAAISVAAGSTKESIENAAAALNRAKYPVIRIELPVSPALMEYRCGKKPAKMLEWISEAVTKAKALCAQVEFCAVDATRAEKDFLTDALKTALGAGAASLSVCDSACELMPDEFAAFVRELSDVTGTKIGVCCMNGSGLALASAILAVQSGASAVKASVNGDTVPLEQLAGVLKNQGSRLGFHAGLRDTELHRIARQILWLSGGAEQTSSPAEEAENEDIRLNGTDDRETVLGAVFRLGYDLSEEDQEKVFSEFRKVAGKQEMGARALDALVASVALQVPPVYTLENYIINNGNIIASSAQVTLKKGDQSLRGICLGDGPIDAAFRAMEQIIGLHCELDDFRIQAVTEGKEAVGSAIVRLRYGGRLYSGKGVSTDIIGAGILAYLAAANKIAFEEA